MQAVAQPDDLLRAQRRRQRGLGLGVVPAGIAVGVQQALAGGQHGAEAVMVDGEMVSINPRRLEVVPGALDNANFTIDGTTLKAGTTPLVVATTGSPQSAKMSVAGYFEWVGW